MAGYAAPCGLFPAHPLFYRFQLAVAGDHSGIRWRDAASAGRSLHKMEADGALRPLWRDPRGRTGLFPAQPAVEPDGRHLAARTRLVATHMVVGRVLRVHGP